MSGHDGSIALAWEEHVWEPEHVESSAMSRRAANRVGREYTSSIPATIADAHILLRADVVAQSEDARAAITRFDAELSTSFPDEFAPLASVLLRTESASSSQIENITAGSRALALAELGITTFDSNARLVVANVDAMQRALELADDVTPDNILAIHEALMRGQKHADPGRLRTEQVWIGGSNESPHDADFIPPFHTRVGPALDDLCAFASRTDLPLLAHAAIAHAQFETIHPFNDGNGRTGRALVHSMLKQAGATTRMTVPVSAGLLADTDSYFEALTRFRAGDPNPMVTRFSEASFAAIRNGRQLADDLLALYDEWRTKLDARADSVAWQVLPLLLSQPAVTSKYVQQRTDASQPAVDRALKRIADAGIVVAKSEHGEGHRRDMVWRSRAVIEALDEFAERARRSRVG